MDHYTVRQLADALDMPPRTIRWHCESPRGLLYGKARREAFPTGRAWIIDAADAEAFAAAYERYQRKGDDA